MTTTSCSGLHRCHPPYAVGVGLHSVPAVAPMLMEVDGRWWVTWRDGKCCKPTPVAHMHHHMAHGMTSIPQCIAARLQAAHRCPCVSMRLQALGARVIGLCRGRLGGGVGVVQEACPCRS